MNILEKLDQTELRTDSFLSSADLAFCLSLLAQYEKVIGYYNLIVETIAPLQSAGKDLNPVQDGLKTSMAEMQTTLNGFKDTVSATNTRLVNAVTYYFEKTYSLSIDRFDVIKGGYSNKPFEDLNPVLEYIISQVGTDFVNAGHKRVIDLFRNKINNQWKAPVLKKNKLSIPDFVYIEESYRGSKKFSISYNSRDTLVVLMNALNFFNNGVCEMSHLQSSVLDNLKRDTDSYPVTSQISFGGKAQDLKVYKNGKVEVIFETDTAASEFAKLIDLANIIQRERC